MRKLGFLVLSLCLACALVACGKSEQQEDRIKVVNASAEELYGFGYTYYINENIVSSGGACNADNSAIKIGDVFPLENHSSLENAKNVELELSVVDKEGVEYPCATKISLDEENEIPCEIKVTGDFENGFDASVETN